MGLPTSDDVVKENPLQVCLVSWRLVDPWDGVTLIAKINQHAYLRYVDSRVVSRLPISNMFMAHRLLHTLFMIINMCLLKTDSRTPSYENTNL